MEIDYEGVERGSFEAFAQIVEILRSEQGCPWDRAQTFESLKPCMVNEMTEALAGISLYRTSGDASNLCEELGDVLLQVVLLSQIAREQGLFSVEDVVRGISRKMLRRHPHVFGVQDGSAASAFIAEEKGKPERKQEPLSSPQEIPGLWEAIKREEKKNRTLEQARLEKEAFLAAAQQITAQLADTVSGMTAENPQ